MNTDYTTFKSSMNGLERLQAFKVPLTRLWENFIYCYGALDHTHEDLCEFFLISDAPELEIGNLDQELEETVIKLAQLLAAKEQQLKENVKQFVK